MAISRRFAVRDLGRPVEGRVAVAVALFVAQQGG